MFDVASPWPSSFPVLLSDMAVLGACRANGASPGTVTFDIVVSAADGRRLN